MTAGVQGIRSIDVEVAAIGAVASFYRDVWLLDEVGQGSSSRFFRGTSSKHHILGLHPCTAMGPGIRRIVFDVANVDVATELRGRIGRFTSDVEEIHEFDIPGGGIGFGFKDTEGRNYAVVTGAALHPGKSSPEPDRPHKISHVNLNSGNYDVTAKFVTEALGFRLIDKSARAGFFHANCPDHFSLAVVRSTDATLNHIAFEVADIDSVMRGAGRMRDNGYPIEWGVGRHGPGNNVFAYFAGPEEIPLEYTAEVLQVDDTYVPRGPGYWKFPPGRADQWGVTNPPSARLARIQQLFRFTPDGFRTRVV